MWSSDREEKMEDSEEVSVYSTKVFQGQIRGRKARAVSVDFPMTNCWIGLGGS